MGAILYPIAIMQGAAWNILDYSGCRIAWCGYDNDHEKSGPPIAAELVRAVNAFNDLEARLQGQTENAVQLALEKTDLRIQLRDLESRLAELECERNAALERAKGNEALLIDSRFERDELTEEVHHLRSRLAKLERLREACEKKESAFAAVEEMNMGSIDDADWDALEQAAVNAEVAYRAALAACQPSESSSNP